MTALLLAVLLAAELPSPAEIQRIFAELGAITGLDTGKPVAVERMSREQLHAYLKKRIGETAKPEDIRNEELTLKWLGLVPDSFDFERSTVDLLTEQAAAFYDYRKKRLVLLENPIGEYDRTVLAHELAHALADRHFRIGRYLDAAAKTDDGAMARQAVIEGQASWLALEWENRQEGRPSLLEDDRPLPSQSSLDVNGSPGFPELEKAPLYLRVSLLFPYWEGGRFQQAVARAKGAGAIREVFRTPPETTQQILHPDLYLNQTLPEPAALPKIRLRGWKTISQGTLGELDHLVIYRLGAGHDAAALAREWRGSRYEVRRRKDRCCLVRYSSIWRTEEAAQRALEAWMAHCAAKARRGVMRAERVGRAVHSIEQPAR